jgi:ABC-type uncharacterized transport system involved in gliding motility auxiliary subunit
MVSRAGAWAWFLVVGCAGAPATSPSEPAPAASRAPAASAATPSEPPPAALPELARASLRIVGTFSGPVEVTVYASDSPPEIRAAGDGLVALLRAYEKASGGKLGVRVNTLATESDRRRAAAEELQAFVVEGENGSLSNAYLGIVFRYREKKKVIPQMQAAIGRGAEFWVTNKLRELRDEADGTQHRIGLVAQKSELKLGEPYLVPPPHKDRKPSVRSIIEQAFPFYRFEEVDLRGGAAKVDEGFAGLVVTQPGRDYTEAELRRIDEYLMLGNKAVAVFASAASLKASDPSMTATLDLHNLEPLLTGYGIQLNEDVVYDFGEPFRVQVETEGGPAIVRHPGIARVTSQPGSAAAEHRLDSSFIAFFRMDEVMFPFASSITLLPERQPQGVKVYGVARTTPTSSVDRARTSSLKLRADWKPQPPLSERIVAAVAEGNLKSAFSDTRTTDGETRPSRVLVVASGYFLINPFVYSGSSTSAAGQELYVLAQPYTKHLTSTILVFKNTLDWMMSEGDFTELSAVIRSDAKRPAEQRRP